MSFDITWWHSVCEIRRSESVGISSQQDSEGGPSSLPKGCCAPPWIPRSEPSLHSLNPLRFAQNQFARTPVGALTPGPARAHRKRRAPASRAPAQAMSSRPSRIVSAHSRVNEARRINVYIVNIFKCALSLVFKLFHALEVGANCKHCLQSP